MARTKSSRPPAREKTIDKRDEPGTRPLAAYDLSRVSRLLEQSVAVMVAASNSRDNARAIVLANSALVGEMREVLTEMQAKGNERT